MPAETSSYATWVATQPTPVEVTRAWEAMHANLNDKTMKAWESACAKASAAAHAQYKKFVESATSPD